jgi:hypothetical protein
VERWNHARGSSGELLRRIRPDWAELSHAPLITTRSPGAGGASSVEGHGPGERDALCGVGRVQVVRSAAEWSCGLEEPDTSMYCAWATAIGGAAPRL